MDVSEQAAGPDTQRMTDMGKIKDWLTTVTWKCPECGHKNAQGTIHCAQCGK